MSVISRPFPVNLSSAGSWLSIFAPLALSAGDWPNLRGPDHNGISTETTWKSTGETPILWEAEVGLGHSAIVVADGRAYTLGHDGKDTDTLWCLDTTNGEVLWKHSYPHPLDDLYFPGGSTGTPTVVDGRVYSLARRGQLFCLEANSGKIVWQKHLTDDFGCKMPDWGFTGAPRAHGDFLLLNAGEAGMALKQVDGTPVWQSKASVEAGYSTPHLFTRGDQTLAIFSNKDGYTCVNPASGATLWFYKHKTRYGVNATEPVIDGNHFLIATGYGKGAALLEWSGSGDPVEIWRSRELQNQMNPGLLIGDHLYTIHGDEGKDGTGLRCVDYKTGEVGWVDESVGHGALTAADGKLIVLTEGGELRIGPASPEGFHPTLTRQVISPKCWTIPVLSNGLLYCRNSKGRVAVVDLR